MGFSLERLSKRFGELLVLEPLTLEIADGEFVALVGPSGSGKSTLLHMLAGLEPLTSGRLSFGGESVRAPAPERSLVFQEHALYPWLTLQDNVALALEFQGQARREARREAADWLARVELAGFERYYPHQVSGGMKQRAALARAFIARPKALLLDEPFGALDALTRLKLQQLLRQLVADARMTVVLVTHDVSEAIYLTERLIVLSPRPGRVLADLPVTDDPQLKHEVLALLGLRLEPAKEVAHA